MIASGGIENDSRSVVQEGGFFSLQRVLTEAQIVRKLIKLRDENFPTEIDFTVHGIAWTEIISNEMIKTFQHYRDTGHQWNEATFNDFGVDDPSQHAHFHSVLQAAVSTKLFRRLTFSNELTVERPLTSKSAISLAHVLRNGQHLERVTIFNFEINNVSMSMLAQGLVTDDTDENNNVAPKKLELHAIRFTREEEGTHETRSAEECLADGLERNKTLVSFSFCGCHQNDSTASLVVRSLIGHPSLKELRLSEVEFGAATTSSICCLLSSPTCQLSDLQMVDHTPVAVEGDAEFDVERFIEQIPTNRSLESLTLSDYTQSAIDHYGANRLLASLWKLPGLTSLDLSTNSIQDLVFLASNLRISGPQSRLRILDLDDNDYIDQSMGEMGGHSSVQAILHLLDEIFPELGYLGEDFADAIETEIFPQSVAERIDLNRCTGLLLRGGRIALSVWPTVIAKANGDRFLQDAPSRRANVLYHMLQGPAFVGRGALF